MTRSLYQVSHFEFTCALKHALTHHLFWGRARRPKFHEWCLEKQKKNKHKKKIKNVAGQGQPNHFKNF